MLPWHAVYCRDESLLQMLGVTLHFKWTLTMLVVFQSLSHVQLFETPSTAEHQVSLSFTISRSLRKLMSIELVMPSNHLVLCCPLLLYLQFFPTSGSFPMSWLFTSGDQSIGALASVSVLPVNIQGCFPLEFTGLISLLFKGLFKCLLQHHSSKASILQHSAFFMVWLSHPYMTPGKVIAVTIWIFEGKAMSLLFNVSRCVTTLEFTAKATEGSYEFILVV